MGRPSLKERVAARKARTLKQKTKQRKKQATELSKLEAGGAHKTNQLFGRDWWGTKKHSSKSPVHKQRRKHLKSKLNIPNKPQTNKDHLGRDSSVGTKKRYAVRKTPASEETLNKVREKYAKKAEKKTEKTTEKTTEKKKANLQVKVDPKIGSKLPKTFDKPKAADPKDKAAKDKAAKVSKRKKWAKMTKAQRKASNRADKFARAKAYRNRKKK